jgi:hypothetical protein
MPLLARKAVSIIQNVVADRRGVYTASDQDDSFGCGCHCVD